MRVIESILKDNAMATLGVKHYGRGVKSYANLEQKAYPRIWVHLINPRDIIHQNGAITSSYEVVAEVSTVIDYTNDIANNETQTEKYLTTLEELQAIYYRYIGMLNKDHRNKLKIGNVNRREILHEYDDNLCGYVFTFTMTVKETIAYQC